PTWLPSRWQQALAAMTALDPVARPTAADTARQLATLADTVAPDAVATAPASASPSAATAVLGSPVPSPSVDRSPGLRCSIRSRLRLLPRAGGEWLAGCAAGAPGHGQRSPRLCCSW
ncbi:MAG: hypothetical protein QOK11_3704, partial [Pseudonocardiales bacterium]|nr:hypothetical protein [Pseudonocardiales bacterium]